MVLLGSFLLVYLVSPGSYVRTTLSLLHKGAERCSSHLLHVISFSGLKNLDVLVVPPIEAFLCFFHSVALLYILSLLFYSFFAVQN